MFILYSAETQVLPAMYVRDGRYEDRPSYPEQACEGRDGRTGHRANHRPSVQAGKHSGPDGSYRETVGGVLVRPAFQENRLRVSRMF